MGSPSADWLMLPFTGPIGPLIAGGQRQQREQKRALREQQATQRQAETIAERQIHDNARAMREAEQRRRPITSLLDEAAKAGTRGLGSTMLTGSRGVTSSLPLGRSTLLGGGS